jgi:hypothetical protein
LPIEVLKVLAEGGLEPEVGFLDGYLVVGSSFPGTRYHGIVSPDQRPRCSRGNRSAFDETGHPTVCIRGGGTQPEGNRKRRLVHQLFHVFEKRLVEDSAGVDLEEHKFLTGVGSGLDRIDHEMKRRGIQRAADVDDVDTPAFPLSAGTKTSGEQ